MRVGDPAHPRSPEGLGLDQAEALEIAQRLAHRGLARSELPREARLDEPLARLQLPAEDPLEQDLLDLLPQNGS
jgi:hypothetical protein